MISLNCAIHPETARTCDDASTLVEIDDCDSVDVGTCQTVGWVNLTSGAVYVAGLTCICVISCVLSIGTCRNTISCGELKIIIDWGARRIVGLAAVALSECWSKTQRTGIVADCASVVRCLPVVAIGTYGQALLSVVEVHRSSHIPTALTSRCRTIAQNTRSTASLAAIIRNYLILSRQAIKHTPSVVYLLIIVGRSIATAGLAVE